MSGAFVLLVSNITLPLVSSMLLPFSPAFSSVFFLLDLSIFVNTSFSSSIFALPAVYSASRFADVFFLAYLLVRVYAYFHRCYPSCWIARWFSSLDGRQPPQHMVLVCAARR